MSEGSVRQSPISDIHIAHQSTLPPRPYLTKKLIMAPAIIPGLLTNLIYPATLTAIGLWGNAFILGGQIKEVKDEIKEVKHEVKDVKDELGGQIKEVKHYIKGLIARQTEMELHDMSVAAKLFKDCGKN